MKLWLQKERFADCKACGKQHMPFTRGVCSECYHELRRAVRDGYTTWAELVKAGKINDAGRASKDGRNDGKGQAGRVYVSMVRRGLAQRAAREERSQTT